MAIDQSLHRQFHQAFVNRPLDIASTNGSDGMCGVVVVVVVSISRASAEKDKWKKRNYVKDLFSISSRQMPWQIGIYLFDAFYSLLLPVDHRMRFPNYGHSWYRNMYL